MHAGFAEQSNADKSFSAWIFSGKASDDLIDVLHRLSIAILVLSVVPEGCCNFVIQARSGPTEITRGRGQLTAIDFVDEVLLAYISRKIYAVCVELCTNRHGSDGEALKERANLPVDARGVGVRLD